MSGFWLKDMQETRLEGMRWSLQLTDRTLSGIDGIKLNFQHSNLSMQAQQHAAYSIGTNITIHTDKVKDFYSDRGIASLLGLNYHELAHVIYTWFKWQDIADQIARNGKSRPANFTDAYNMLEESRVESLLAARFPRMEKYFTLVLADYIVGSPDPRTFLLVHGRKYLPKKIRDMYRKRYAESFGEDQTRSAEKLIDQYRTVVYPSGIAKGADLIHEFSKLLPSDSGWKGGAPHQNPVGGSVGDSSSSQDQRRAKEDAEKAENREGGNSGEGQGAERDDDEKSLPSQGGGSGQDQEDTSPQPGQQGSGGLDGDDGQGSQQPGGGDSSGDSRADQGSGRGTGTGKSRENQSPPILSDIQDELKDLTQEILRDDSVQADIQNTREKMEDYRNGVHSSIQVHQARRFKHYPVTEAMRSRSERYAEELRRIWLAMEPGWTYGASEGRLDMNRVFSATTPEEFEDVYASWDEGKQHSAKTIGVLLCDESASMGGGVYNSKNEHLGRRIDITAQNIWEIKSACQTVDIELAVIMYDNTCRILYEFEELVEPDKFALPYNQGNTNPTGAVIEARRMLSQADVPGKFLISLTDGQWPGMPEIPASLDSLHDVVKGCGLIRHNPKTPWSFEKNFDIVRHSSGDMFGLMSEVVTQIMTRNLESW